MIETVIKNAATYHTFLDKPEIFKNIYYESFSKKIN